jgi:hypothetical protein
MRLIYETAPSSTLLFRHAQITLPGFFHPSPPSSLFPVSKITSSSPFFFLFCCSFNADYQMVINAQVIVSLSLTQDAIVQPQELLYPPRHQITLPLNSLNFIFNNIEVAFNQTTKLTADK